MKLAPARLATFLAKPDAALRAALVYGGDAGLVRERADRLAASACSDLKDPFRVSDLAAAAQSLTGGRRVLRVRDAGDSVGALFERFLAAPALGDNLVVVEAAELAARSSLRRAFEAAPNAVAIACYGDGMRDIEALAREVLGTHGIRIDGEALAYLAQYLGGDRLASRSELEKLALFVGDGGRVGIAEAREAVGDSAALSLDDVVESAAEGDAAALERTLARAFQEGEMPVGVLRAVQRHFQRLHFAASQIAAGARAEEAMAQLRPPVFFKLQEPFKRQLRLWPARRAEQALQLLLEAELNAKRTGLPADAICRDALLRIARRAGAKTRDALV